jgi:hypothetical protein
LPPLRPYGTRLHLFRLAQDVGPGLYFLRRFAAGWRSPSGQNPVPLLLLDAALQRHSSTVDPTAFSWGCVPGPQRLKPVVNSGLIGTAEAVPFPVVLVASNARYIPSARATVLLQVKGGGQECPPHIFAFSTEGGGFPQTRYVTDNLY